MTAAEFIEENLYRRLNDRSRDVREVSQYEYEHIMQQLDRLITNFVKRTTVAGLSDDDLRSLYAMKVHQTLRRGFYDRTKKPQIYFWWVLSNLNRDINRLKEVAVRQGMDLDASSDAIYVGAVESAKNSSYDTHPLDKIIDRLSEKEQRIINIALDRLDENDAVLLPLAAEIMHLWLE